MGRKFLILFFISGFSLLRCFSQNSDTDVKLHQIVSQYGQAEVFVPYKSIISFDVLTTNVSILSVKDKVVYISLSPLTVEWFISQRYAYSIVEKISAKSIITAESVEQVTQWDSYPTNTQYDSVMKSFATNYPLLCRLDTIGKSVNGKLVLALKISRNASAD